jgi:hypothetical protein
MDPWSYYYYPTYEVYYNPFSNRYFYSDHGIWVSDSIRPAWIYRDINNYVILEIEDERPYHRHQEIQRRFPRQEFRHWDKDRWERFHMQRDQQQREHLEKFQGRQTERQRREQEQMTFERQRRQKEQQEKLEQAEKLKRQQTERQRREQEQTTFERQRPPQQQKQDLPEILQRRQVEGQGVDEEKPGRKDLENTELQQEASRSRPQEEVKSDKKTPAKPRRQIEAPKLIQKYKKLKKEREEKKKQEQKDSQDQEQETEASESGQENNDQSGYQDDRKDAIRNKAKLLFLKNNRP